MPNSLQCTVLPFRKEWPSSPHSPAAPGCCIPRAAVMVVIDVSFRHFCSDRVGCSTRLPPLTHHSPYLEITTVKWPARGIQCRARRGDGTREKQRGPPHFRKPRHVLLRVPREGRGGVRVTRQGLQGIYLVHTWYIYLLVSGSTVLYRKFDPTLKPSRLTQKKLWLHRGYEIGSYVKFFGSSLRVLH